MKTINPQQPSRTHKYKDAKTTKSPYAVEVVQFPKSHGKDSDHDGEVVLEQASVDEGNEKWGST